MISFAFAKERVWKKINGWNSSAFSGGREIDSVESSGSGNTLL